MSAKEKVTLVQPKRFPPIVAGPAKRERKLDCNAWAFFMFPWTCIAFFLVVFVWAKADALSSAGHAAASSLPHFLAHMSNGALGRMEVSEAAVNLPSIAGMLREVGWLQQPAAHAGAGSDPFSAPSASAVASSSAALLSQLTSASSVASAAAASSSLTGGGQLARHGQTQQSSSSASAPAAEAKAAAAHGSGGAVLLEVDASVNDGHLAAAVDDAHLGLFLEAASAAARASVAASATAASSSSSSVTDAVRAAASAAVLAALQRGEPVPEEAAFLLQRASRARAGSFQYRAAAAAQQKAAASALFRFAASTSGRAVADDASAATGGAGADDHHFDDAARYRLWERVRARAAAEAAAARGDEAVAPVAAAAASGPALGRFRFADASLAASLGSGASAGAASSSTASSSASAGATGMLGLMSRLQSWAREPSDWTMGFPHHVEAVGLVLELLAAVMAGVCLLMVFLTPPGNWRDVRAHILTGRIKLPPAATAAAASEPFDPAATRSKHEVDTTCTAGCSGADGSHSSSSTGASDSDSSDSDEPHASTPSSGGSSPNSTGSGNGGEEVAGIDLRPLFYERKLGFSVERKQKNGQMASSAGGSPLAAHLVVAELITRAKAREDAARVRRRKALGLPVDPVAEAASTRLTRKLDEGAAAAASGIGERICRKCESDDPESVGHADVEMYADVGMAVPPPPRPQRFADGIPRPPSDLAGVPKPDRCHHCRMCGECVLEMDHHCPWVGNVCIGAHNRKYFVLLLFYAAMALTVFVIWMLPAFVSACSSLADLRRQFVYLFAWFFAAGMWAVVTPFACFHGYLVARNLTTVEWCEKASAAAANAAPQAVTTKSALPVERQRELALHLQQALALVDADWQENAARLQQQTTTGTGTGGNKDGGPVVAPPLVNLSALQMDGLRKILLGTCAATPSEQDAALPIRLTDLKDHRMVWLMPERRLLQLQRAQLYAANASPYNNGFWRNVSMVLGRNPLTWPLPLTWNVPLRPPYTGYVSPDFEAITKRVEERDKWRDHSLSAVYACLLTELCYAIETQAKDDEEALTNQLQELSDYCRRVEGARKADEEEAAAAATAAVRREREQRAAAAAAVATAAAAPEVVAAAAAVQQQQAAAQVAVVVGAGDVAVPVA